MRASLTFVAVGGLLFAAATKPDVKTTGVGSALEDSVMAVRVLVSARNATPLLCEFAIRTLNGGFGSWGGRTSVPDAWQDEASIVDWALQDLEDPTAIPVLDAGLADPDPCARRIAARLLGRMNHPEAETRLLRRLAARDAVSREMAAIALGFSDWHSAVPALVDALTDSEVRVRTASAWALGAIEDPSAIPALVDRLGNDADPLVRQQAAWAIGRMW